MAESAPLEQRVKAYLRTHRGAGRGLRLTDLLHLSADPKRQGRDIDRALQRLRKAGEISFDSKRGWAVVPQVGRQVGRG